MIIPGGIVYVLDDEPELVKALTRLLVAKRFEVRGFTSVRAFLGACRPQDTACLVLDVAMPELDGLELQRHLTHKGILIPVVFLTGHGDIPMSVRAMKAGAVDFLTKPFHDKDLLTVIRAALGKDSSQQSAHAERETILRRLETLTPRERQVFDLVIQGLLNKQVAADLGASEQTIKVHRHRVMEKMGVPSLAELVQAAVKAGVLTV